MYKRVLLKLSGEAMSNGSDNPFYSKHLDQVASEIKKAHDSGIEIGVVIGGGNIYRGKFGEELGMDRIKGDYIGMLATIMNSLALSNSLTKIGVENKVFSALSTPVVCDDYNPNIAINELESNKVVIFGGGTGKPYFSTDTCAALRAIETKCDIILMAKNGVDGIYNKDPRKYNDATRYESISYQEVIDNNLEVMDLTAAKLCKDNNMPLFVFNMNTEGNIAKACLSSVTGTIVK